MPFEFGVQGLQPYQGGSTGLASGFGSSPTGSLYQPPQGSELMSGIGSTTGSNIERYQPKESSITGYGPMAKSDGTQHGGINNPPSPGSYSLPQPDAQPSTGLMSGFNRQPFSSPNMQVREGFGSSYQPTAATTALNPPGVGPAPLFPFQAGGGISQLMDLSMFNPAALAPPPPPPTAPQPPAQTPPADPSTVIYRASGGKPVTYPTAGGAPVPVKG